MKAKKTKGILITGGTGFIGRKLIEKLLLQGYSDIRILSRRAKPTMPYPVKVFQWDPKKKILPHAALEGTQAVIHLAGENVADSKWDDSKKERIMSSRVATAQLLVDRIERMDRPPAKFVSASAIGFYGSRGDTVLDESSPKGEGFLADVCEKWEDQALRLKESPCKPYIMRIGMVLDEKEGALAKATLPFRLGLGGKVGDGSQYVSWIHIDDLIKQFVHVIAEEPMHEIYNCVSPIPVTNEEFTNAMANALNKPAFLAAPQVGIRVFLGELGESLNASLRVVPGNFMEEDFEFGFPEIGHALKDALKHAAKGEEVFERAQFIALPVENVFGFFAKAENLELITPPTLRFKILSSTDENIKQGTLIDYRLKLYGAPIRWKTRINEFVPNKRFVDEQIKGPYKKWVHTHEFYEVAGGVLMKDRVVYKLPMGMPGNLVAGGLVRNDLKKIFNFRYSAINNDLSKHNQKRGDQ